MRKITAEMKDYIRAHADDQPREHIAEVLGISISTLYRQLHECGAKMCVYDHVALGAFLRAHYPTMSSREITASYGIPLGTVKNVARRLGLKHTRATAERLAQKSLDNLKVAPSQETLLARGRRQHRLWVHEYERLWESKPQLTRLRLARVTARARKAKSHLKRHWHYEPHPTEPYTMVITTDTRRTPREAHYVRKYGMKFIELHYESQ